jgi:hypothetical protein
VQLLLLLLLSSELLLPVTQKPEMGCCANSSKLGMMTLQQHENSG